MSEPPDDEHGHGGPPSESTAPPGSTPRPLSVWSPHVQNGTKRTLAQALAALGECAHEGTGLLSLTAEDDTRITWCGACGAVCVGDDPARWTFPELSRRVKEEVPKVARYASLLARGQAEMTRAAKALADGIEERTARGIRDLLSSARTLEYSSAEMELGARALAVHLGSQAEVGPRVASDLELGRPTPPIAADPDDPQGLRAAERLKATVRDLDEVKATIVELFSKRNNVED